MSDKEEILKEINDYVAEQRIEDDLSKVRGYGIDSAGRSVSFRMTGLKEIRTDLNSLSLKSKQLEDSVESNSRNIGGLTDEVARVGSLSDNNRTEISRIDGDMGNLRKRLTEDEAKYDNAASQIAETAEIASNALDVSSETRVRMAETEDKVEDFERRLRNVPVQLATLDPSAVAIGQIFQYTGDSTADAQRGGFYFYDGAVFARIKVDPEYKAGKDIEITDDGTINATFDHSPIEAEIKAVADDLTAHKTAQATKDKAQDDATKANTDAIATLNGGEQTSGSVKNTVLDYIGKAQHARFKVVDTLPPVKDAESNVLYLVPFEGKEGVYKQYILADGRFVQLDNTEVDLSDYYTKHETDTAISDVADALAAKDTEQDGRISALESKPSPTSQCVPYSADLDYVSDDLGVAWMNIGEGREFGHIYRKEPGETINIPVGTRYCTITSHEEVVISGDYYEYRNVGEMPTTTWEPWEDENPFDNFVGAICEGKETWGDKASVVYFFDNDWDESISVKVATHEKGTSRFVIENVEYQAKGISGSYPVYEHVNINGDRLLLLHHSCGLFVVKEDDGEYHLDTEVYNIGAKSNKRVDVPIVIERGGWKDVYDTSTISADITAEVQRATTAESALSTRIDAKADASTWSTNLKNQIDSDHTALGGLSATWTGILKSQIDADHTTLGNLSGYLTSAKQSAINNAISLAHAQNTDTQLKDGKLKVESNKISATLPIVSSGDIEGKDVSTNTTHLLSKKLNADMLRMYSSWSAMEADKSNIPEGAWVAITEY